MGFHSLPNVTVMARVTSTYKAAVLAFHRLSVLRQAIVNLRSNLRRGRALELHEYNGARMYAKDQFVALGQEFRKLIDVSSHEPLLSRWAGVLHKIVN